MTMNETVEKRKRDRERLDFAMYVYKKHILWREMAVETLLTNLAPRIHALSKQFYRGCEFHYHLQQELGQLLRSTAIIPEPCMNRLDKFYDEYLPTWCVQLISFQILCEDVIKAEQSMRKNNE